MAKYLCIVGLCLLMGCGTETERVIVPAQPSGASAPVSVSRETKEVERAERVTPPAPPIPVVPPVEVKKPEPEVVVPPPAPAPVPAPVVVPPPVDRYAGLGIDLLKGHVKVRPGSTSEVQISEEAFETEIACTAYPDRSGAFALSARAGKTEVEIYNVPFESGGNELSFGGNLEGSSLSLSRRLSPSKVARWASVYDSQTRCRLTLSRQEASLRGEISCTSIGSIDHALPLLDLSAVFSCYFRP